jgi:hypothetical protein
MPSRVYTLTQTNNRTGFVIGVFADRNQAIDAALLHAERMIQRYGFLAGNLLMPAHSADKYGIQIVTDDDRLKLYIVYRPTDELDLVSWDIWPFDVIEPAAPLADGTPADQRVAAE